MSSKELKDEEKKVEEKKDEGKKDEKKKVEEKKVEKIEAEEVKPPLSIGQKLALVQVEMNVPKGHFNEYGKFQYRKLEDTLSAFKKVSSKYGVHIEREEDVVVKEQGWTYVKSTVALVDDITAERIKATAFARESQMKNGVADPAQLTGMSTTYARKRATDALFLLDDGVDPDDLAPKDPEGKATPDAVKKSSKAVIASMPTTASLERCKALEIDLKSLANYLKKKISDLTEEDLVHACATKEQFLASKKEEHKGEEK